MTLNDLFDRLSFYLDKNSKPFGFGNTPHPQRLSIASSVKNAGLKK